MTKRLSSTTPGQTNPAHKRRLEQAEQLIRSVRLSDREVARLINGISSRRKYRPTTKAEKQFIDGVLAGKPVSTFRENPPGSGGFVTTTIKTSRGLMPNPAAFQLPAPRRRVS